MAAMGVQMHHASSREQGQQQQQQQIHSSYLPASPTLTNPDMILPDYPDYDRPVSPGIDLDDARIHPSLMWQNAHTVGGVGSDLSQFEFFSNSSDQNHQDHPYGPTGPITPTTPIIYGNGTMLSDIGEVTEVESTPGKPSPGRLKANARARQQYPNKESGSDAPLRSSPTMGLAGMKKRAGKITIAQRERSSSMESTSTVTTQEKQELFADFDDSVSVGDSVFQGDDEESVAESYTAPEPARNTARLGVPASDNLDRLSISSSTSLSRRAEEILANAKKKLTTMENNLTRARTSLHVTNSSLSSFDSQSTPSPPRHRASTAEYRRYADPGSPTYSPGHAQVLSDDIHGLGAPRSASAFGISGGYRQPLVASHNGGPIRYSLDPEQRRVSDRVAPHPRDLGGLAPLNEDALDVDHDPSDETPPSAKLDHFSSPTFGPHGDKDSNNGQPIQRSTSVAQVRGLKDQVEDLKGKISSLREQARVDSLKRRSLQSLRTPSPFTHAQVDQWYAETKPSRLSIEIDGVMAGVGRNPWDGDVAAVDGIDKVATDFVKEEYTEDEESVYTDVENATQLRPPTSHSTRHNLVGAPHPTEVEEVVEDKDDDISDMHTENGDDDDTGNGIFQDVQDESALLVEDDYDSESGESLYHDTFQHPISHEDREDAFDYEHFFLHSAMGTMSQQRMARRGSGSSYSSEGSVETTRGPIINDNSNGSNAGRTGSSDGTGSPLPALQARRNSNASISTIGTFATANDGSGGKGSGGSTPADEQLRELNGHAITVPAKKRSNSPESASRMTFAHSTIGGHEYVSRPSNPTRNSIASFKSIPEEGGKEKTNPFAGFNPRSIPRRTMSNSATSSLHRPSISSFDSTGTNRSFPLVNRPKKASSVGMLTPQNSSPDQELQAVSESLLNETASVLEQQQHGGQGADGRKTDGWKHDRARNGSALDFSNGTSTGAITPQAMQGLFREDRYLVERLVGNLGSCVLGLTENGKASAESRMYRRRIDAARRILEGLDPA